jgi:acyl-CoA reductase-like NAD-dependent aldehyde dehydrogenase
VSLSTFRTFDEAMTWINLTPCGPAISLYTQDRASIERFKREGRADIANINPPAEDPEARLPFSGHGTRPGGQLALDGFTRWQAVSDDAVDAPRPEGVENLTTHSFIQTDWASL